MKLHPFDGTRPAWQVLALLILRVWVAAIAVLWALQDAIMFPGWWLRTEDPTMLHDFAASTGFKIVQVPASDGNPAVLWVHSVGADRAVLYWHGNGELVADHTELSHWLGTLGWDFIGVELRGYGDAPGWPRQATLDRDAAAAWAWATSDGGYAANRLVLYGRSIGGGPAAQLAASTHPAGLVLDATFDSLEGVSAQRVPFVPGLGWLLRSPYRTVDLTLDLPVLQLHGTADEVIDIERARSLRKHLSNVTFVEAAGFHHNDEIVLADDESHRVAGAWLDGVVPNAVPALPIAPTP